MSKERTLRNSRDFHRVKSSGRRGHSDGVTVWVSQGAGEDSRVGVSARSRRAVERNRIRRRLRAAWRETVPAPRGDVVVVADESSLSLAYQDLVNHLKSALNRAESGR